LAGWIFERAALTPDRVAIDFEDRLTTYAELAAAASRRARALEALGCAHGARVATLARNCPEQVELFFACAANGLALVPLNWRLAPHELAYQMNDSGASVLFVGEGLRQLADEVTTLFGTPVPVLPLEAGVPSGVVPAEPLVPSSSGRRPVLDDDPLLVIYTSGTTGRPRGAVLTHANCFWTNLSFDRTAPVGSDDIVLQVLPQCHVGGWNVQALLAWWKGARVVLERGFDAGRALRAMERKRVTTMMGVPTNYLLLAEHEEFACADLASLRYLIVGGAPMPKPLLERWLARGVLFLQGYGLTEAAPNVLCVPPEDALRKAGSAGRPYLHVQVALRDLSGRDEPLVQGPGVGELLVSGPNVFAGYWHDTAATEAAVQDGWLRTGDVAERDADGYYWIRGRLKEVFISGGENVYPAEVEEVLAGHPGVLEAAVVGVPDDRWGEVGVAFVVPAANSDVRPEDLRTYLASRLARFKVPRDLRLVEALPRASEGGKVQKWKLREEI
jgi:fatty-acyl-CoA synthase